MLGGEPGFTHRAEFPFAPTRVPCQPAYTSMGVELVVARFSENIAWVEDLLSEGVVDRVTIYNKGAPIPQPAIALPNTGREAQTYLHHILERYTTLSPITIFTQGHPFDHCPDFSERLRALRSNHISNGPFWRAFGTIERCDGWGRPHHDWHADGSFGLPLNEVLLELFPTILVPPRRYNFAAGACFATSAESIRQHGARLYEHMLQIGLDGFPYHRQNWTPASTWRLNPTGLPRQWDMGHVFERLWPFLFQSDLSRSPSWPQWALEQSIVSR